MKPLALWVFDDNAASVASDFKTWLVWADWHWLTWMTGIALCNWTSLSHSLGTTVSAVISLTWFAMVNTHVDVDTVTAAIACDFWAV